MLWYNICLFAKISVFVACHRSCGHSLQSERWSDTVTSSHHSHWNTLTLATVAAPYGHSSPPPWILGEWPLCIGTRNHYTALWHQASGSTVLGADYGTVCMLNSLTAHSLFAPCFMTHTVFIHWTLGMTRMKQTLTGCGPISLQSRKFSKWIWSTRQVNGTDWQEQQTTDSLDTWEVWDEETGANLSLQQSHFIKYV